MYLRKPYILQQSKFISTTTISTKTRTTSFLLKRPSFTSPTYSSHSSHSSKRSFITFHTTFEQEHYQTDKENSVPLYENINLRPNEITTESIIYGTYLPLINDDQLPPYYFDKLTKRLKDPVQLFEKFNEELFPNYLLDEIFGYSGDSVYVKSAGTLTILAKGTHRDPVRAKEICAASACLQLIARGCIVLSEDDAPIFLNPHKLVYLPNSKQVISPYEAKEFLLFYCAQFNFQGLLKTFLSFNPPLTSLYINNQVFGVGLDPDPINAQNMALLDSARKVDLSDFFLWALFKMRENNDTSPLKHNYSNVIPSQQLNLSDYTKDNFNKTFHIANEMSTLFDNKSFQSAQQIQQQQEHEHKQEQDNVAHFTNHKKLEPFSPDSIVTPILPKLLKSWPFTRKLPINPKTKINVDRLNKKLYKYFLRFLRRHSVAIVTCPTNSRQNRIIPQVILDSQTILGHASICNILVTKSTILQAKKTSSLIAKERREYVGQRSVGYISQNHNFPAPLNGSINYCQTGILLQLFESPEAEKVLSQFSHIIIDQVHERDIQLELLLYKIKHYLSSRTSSTSQSKPKFIFLGDILDPKYLVTYFGKINTRPLPSSSASQDPIRSNVPIYHIPRQKLDKIDFIEFVIQNFRNRFTTKTVKKIDNFLKSIDQYVGREQTINQIQKLSITNSLTKGDISNLESLQRLQRKNEATARYQDNKHDKITSTTNITINDNFYHSNDISFPIRTMVVLIYQAIAQRINKDNNYNSDCGDFLVLLPNSNVIQDVLEYILHDEQVQEFQQLQKSENIFEKLDILPIYPNLSIREKQKLLYSFYNDDGVQGSRKPRLILSCDGTDPFLDSLQDISTVIFSGMVTYLSHDSTQRLSKVSITYADQSHMQQVYNIANREQIRYYSLPLKSHLKSVKSFLSPKIVTAPLESSILQVKAPRSGATKTSITSVMRELLTPPKYHNLESSLKLLKSQNLLNDQHDLTPMGLLVSCMPWIPYQLAKLIVLGVLFRCTYRVVRLAAILSLEGLQFFKSNHNGELNDSMYKFVGDDPSLRSHVFAKLFAFEAYLRVKRNQENSNKEDDVKDVEVDRFINRNNLVKSALESIEAQEQMLMQFVKASGLDQFWSKCEVSKEDGVVFVASSNENTQRIEFLPSLVSAAYAPNLVVHTKNSYKSEWSATDVNLNVDSVISPRTIDEWLKSTPTLYTYTSKYLNHDDSVPTVLNPIPVDLISYLIFAKPTITATVNGDRCLVDGWLFIENIDYTTAQRISKLGEVLKTSLNDILHRFCNHNIGRLQNSIQVDTNNPPYYHNDRNYYNSAPIEPLIVQNFYTLTSNIIDLIGASKKLDNNSQDTNISLNSFQQYAHKSKARSFINHLQKPKM